MNILRLLWLDIQKLQAIRLMYVFTAIPALFAFNGWFTSIAFLSFTFLVPYGMFSYDDTSIAEHFYGVLPVSREQIVVGRYLFALLSVVLMAALMLFINSVCAVLFSWPLLAADFLFALLLGLVCGVVFICAAFPLNLHLGAQKANVYVLGIFVVVFISMSFYGDNLRGEFLPGPFGWIIFCLLALAISCQVSLSLYRKREFYDYVPMKEVRRPKRK